MPYWYSASINLGLMLNLVGSGKETEADIINLGEGARWRMFDSLLVFSDGAPVLNINDSVQASRDCIMSYR